MSWFHTFVEIDAGDHPSTNIDNSLQERRPTESENVFCLLPSQGEELQMGLGTSLKPARKSRAVFANLLDVYSHLFTRRHLRGMVK